MTSKNPPISRPASPAETIKKKSRGLRGRLAESLQDPVTGAVPPEEQILIKHHGIYLQDDRDRREIREEKKLERDYRFMVRLRLPAGDVSAKQWMGICDIVDKNGNGVVKITTRQTVQLHGTLKSRLKPSMQSFHKLGMDSIAACGDVNRNVTATSAPGKASFRAEAHAYAAQISTHLLPKTRAWYDIWINGDNIAEKEEEDPLYQTHYLPRKFKIGIAIPPDNDTDVLTNDLALIAIEEKGKLTGFNIAVGGGMGTTHGNEKTYARLASIIGYAEKKDVLSIAWHIAAIQRDFGDRSDRTQARLKYTLDRMGVEAFVKELAARFGKPLKPAKKTHFTTRNDAYGWQQDAENLWYQTLYVENGCVRDTSGYAVKTALYEIAKTEKCRFRFTSNQNIMLIDIKEKDKNHIEKLLNHYGIHAEKFSPVRTEALACVALNTCPLALAEGQRYLPELLTKIEALLEKHNLLKEALSIRMTGCPNGCARPRTAEIGFIGRSLGRYNLYLGGDALGLRLNRLYAENLDEKGILKTLNPLFASYAKNRKAKERFGDFINRTKTGEKI